VFGLCRLPENDHIGTEPFSLIRDMELDIINGGLLADM
jgi:hypothetical protein